MIVIYHDTLVNQGQFICRSKAIFKKRVSILLLKKVIVIWSRILENVAMKSYMCCLEQVQPQMPMSEKFDMVMSYFSKMAGGEELGFNNSVFLSERDTADRNFALTYFMKENKCFPPGFNLQECLDFYFQVANVTS